MGRPNVGKSSLINALMAEPRAIVSEVPGTTRDAVDIAYTWKGRPFLFVDTAGMRRSGGCSDELERAMTGRTGARDQSRRCLHPRDRRLDRA